MEEIIGYTVGGLLSILLVALVTFAIRLGKRWMQEADDGWRRDLIETLVQAAEQMFGDGRGRDKLAYVRRSLDKRGVEVPAMEIEAAVYRETKGNGTAANGAANGETA